mmetsp:Transcript_42281/g.122219  ORF Transcript_42281/g.122219 Transcript_42281/m.122219 type:complete len:447 (+) Transcript_42281:2-1342(+)
MARVRGRRHHDGPTEPGRPLRDRTLRASRLGAMAAPRARRALLVAAWAIAQALAAPPLRREALAVDDAASSCHVHLLQRATKAAADSFPIGALGLNGGAQGGATPGAAVGLGLLEALRAPLPSAGGVMEPASTSEALEGGRKRPRLDGYVAPWSVAQAAADVAPGGGTDLDGGMPVGATPGAAVGLGLLEAFPAPPSSAGMAPAVGSEDPFVHSELQAARLAMVAASVKVRNASVENEQLRRSELQLREENTRLRALLQAGRSGPMPSRTRTMTTVAIACGSVAGVVGAIALCHTFCAPRSRAGKDAQDGRRFHKDSRQAAEGAEETYYCGLTWKALKSVLFLILVATSGFGALWWAGIIQPFLEQALVYLYLACVLLAILGVMVLEVWDHIGQMQERIHSIIWRVEHFFSVDELQREVTSCCASSPRGATPEAEAGPQSQSMACC